MIVLKTILLGIILATSSLIGVKVSKRYGTRVKELKEIQRALHIFEEKIKFTYEPIPDVFEYISKKCIDNIGNIFLEASKNMAVMSAGEAWEKALDNSNTKLTNDDIDILKGMAKMLGKTDLDGQVSEIRLTEKFIDTKIQEAQLEKNKNEKLYKTLGITGRINYCCSFNVIKIHGQKHIFYILGKSSTIGYESYMCFEAKRERIFK